MNMNMPISMIEPDPPEERPTHGEVLMAVCDRFEASPEEVVSWLADFDRQAAYAEYLAEIGILKGER